MSPASNNNIAVLLSILKPSIADNLATDTDGHNSIELYRILPAIIKSDNPPKIKMAILDCLNPAVIRSTEGLLQNPLNQSTAKAISLGQSLVRRLFEGYKLVIYQLGDELPINPKQTSKSGHLAQCILAACNSRAISGVNYTHCIYLPNSLALPVKIYPTTSALTPQSKKPISNCCFLVAPGHIIFPTMNCALSTANWSFGPPSPSLIEVTPRDFLQ
jgi:hypothetical protein